MEKKLLRKIIQYLLRKEDVSKAYFNCHTDITIPYEELEEISVVTNEGKDIILYQDGRFVLPGTEVLNEPLDKAWILRNPIGNWIVNND